MPKKKSKFGNKSKIHSTESKNNIPQKKRKNRRYEDLSYIEEFYGQGNHGMHTTTHYYSSKKCRVFGVCAEETPDQIIFCDGYSNYKEEELRKQLAIHFKFKNYAWPDGTNFQVFIVPKKNLPYIKKISSNKSVLCCAHDGTKAYLKAHLGIELQSSDRDWYCNHPQTESSGLPAHFTFPVIQSLIKPYNIGFSEIMVKIPMNLAFPEGFTFQDLYGSYMEALGWHPLSIALCNTISEPTHENIINLLEQTLKEIQSNESYSDLIKDKLSEPYRNAIKAQKTARFTFFKEDQEVWGKAWVITREGVANGRGGVGHAEYMAVRERKSNIYQAFRFDHLSNCNYSSEPFLLDYDLEQNYTYQIDPDLIMIEQVNSKGELELKKLQFMINSSYSPNNSSNVIYGRGNSGSTGAAYHPSVTANPLEGSLDAYELAKTLLAENENSKITRSLSSNSPLTVTHFNVEDTAVEAQSGMFDFVNSTGYNLFENMMEDYLDPKDLPNLLPLYYIDVDTQISDLSTLDKIYQSFALGSVNESGLRSVFKSIKDSVFYETCSPASFLWVMDENLPREINSEFLRVLTKEWEEVAFPYILKESFGPSNSSEFFNLKKSITSIPNIKSIKASTEILESKLGTNFIAFLHTKNHRPDLLSCWSSPMSPKSQFEYFKLSVVNGFLKLLDTFSESLISDCEDLSCTTEDIINSYYDNFRAILANMPGKYRIEDSEEFVSNLGNAARYYDVYYFAVAVLALSDNPDICSLRHKLASILHILIFNVTDFSTTGVC